MYQWSPWVFVFSFVYCILAKNAWIKNEFLSTNHLYECYNDEIKDNLIHVAFFHIPTHLEEEGETNLPFHLHNNTRCLTLGKISSWCWYSCLDRYIYRVLSKCERNAEEGICCPKDEFRNTKCQYLSLCFPFIYHWQADIEFSVKK